MIDILIPTFNRGKFLVKNLEHLNELILSENALDKFNVLVSNNCSTDDTLELIEVVRPKLSFPLQIYDQDRNLGLEQNALFLLDKAQADYVMYLGDDDFLPDGYLAFIVATVSKDINLSVIIPGISALHSDGKISGGRNEIFDVNKYEASFGTVQRLSGLGHQLSGVVCRRKNLYSKYMSNQEYRNIYPFIFFVGYCNLSGNSYYAPKYRVLVSVGNAKNWNYDPSGLITEMFKNYFMLYPKDYFKRNRLKISLMLQQSWRIAGHGRFGIITAFCHILFSKQSEMLTRSSLLVLYPYLISRSFLRYIKKHT